MCKLSTLIVIVMHYFILKMSPTEMKIDSTFSNESRLQNITEHNIFNIFLFHAKFSGFDVDIFDTIQTIHMV